ncbi:hypothetical protein LLG46_13860 [bacterium]|nr:hypothetical protein [bacterium]
MKFLKANTAMLAIVCIGIVLVSGCGGGGGGSSKEDTAAPVITNVNADTSSLTFKGGNVTITANVTDDSTIASVIAVTSKKTSGELVSQEPMTLSSGSTYRAVVTAPANTTSSALTCTVVVYASDSLGYQSHTQTSFNVPVAGDSPPSDPF